MGKVEDAAQTMINNLPEKTGKSLKQWFSVLKKVGFDSSSKHSEILKCLKGEHEITHGFANLISTLYRSADESPDTDLVAAQYTGKENLKPIYDKLIKAMNGFGKDVEVSPKKAYVSMRRSKQFAIVQPSTKTRVDVGINLKGEKPTSRLEKSGSFNAMVSHRVKISDVKEVDKELIAWLKQAYTNA